MRKYPDRPIVGVGAVIIDGDRVLLVKRAHEPLKGEWSLPGGAVETATYLCDLKLSPVARSGRTLLLLARELEACWRAA